MKNHLIYLRHILDAINQIESYTDNLKYEKFMADRLYQDAIIRELEIIGEAVRKVHRKITDKYGDIPWKKMAGMRDKLIHNYFGVDLDAVWDTVKEDIPELKEKIENIIKIEE